MALSEVPGKRTFFLYSPLKAFTIPFVFDSKPQALTERIELCHLLTVIPKFYRRLSD
jgi:hypothetical protein